MNSAAPIGVFDSGLGGVNVLAALIRQMPDERYVYFGDTHNNPYGTKPVETVKELTWQGVRWLLDHQAKAIVIACNTATSVVVQELREELDIPVFGIEPAIKPALLSPDQKRILLMATPLTIAEKKLQTLLEQLPHREAVLPLPCPGLAELIEDNPEGPIDKKIRELLYGVDLRGITGVVLGCTHYSLIQGEIQKVIGHPVTFFDGSDGLARHVNQVLAERQVLSSQRKNSCVLFYFTDSPESKRSQAMAILKGRGVSPLVCR